MNEDKPLGIGAIGVGGFGYYAMEQFLQNPKVRLVAIAGTHPEAATAAIQRFNTCHLEETSALLSDPEVDLIYIANPPFLHHPQALAALQAGKHVIVEKPLATSAEHARELVQLARDRDLLCIANLMQRYNPVYDAVAELVASKALGECLHGWLENYASDEKLSPDHWFWDPAKSGGIFLEHGVHFFDMFQGWLGPGDVVAAQRVLRPDSEIEEQVQCTIRYQTGPLVNFYHGFTQPVRLDRQEFRLLFEHGDLTLEEWVPIRGRIRAAVTDDQLRVLVGIFPDAEVEIRERYGVEKQKARSRHQDREFDLHAEIAFGKGADKMRRYGELLRSLLADQLAWIQDRTHRRKITEENGRDSVVLAERATQFAAGT